MKNLLLLISFCSIQFVIAQNSMVGDGFGGRLWYNPTNYSAGSYSAFSICYSLCDSGETQLYGWGNNNLNQLGLGMGSIGSVLGVTVPVTIPLMNNVKYYSAGYMAGAIKNDSTGWAWGNPITGDPIEVIEDVKFLDAGSISVSFVKYDGTVWSVGSNSQGNFGDGTTIDSPTIPIQMSGISNAVRVSNNQYGTVVLLADSTLAAVGDNSWGHLGLGSTITSTLTPLAISGLSKIIDVKSNKYGSIALTSTGDVYTWGDGAVFPPKFIPTKIPSLKDIVAISGCDDGQHFMALDEDKNCYAWSDNAYGQCGLSSITHNYITTPILVETNVIDIMAGETFSYLVKSDRSLWCTGKSSFGSIWLNLSNIQREKFTLIDPSQVPEACNVVGVEIFATATPCSGGTPGTIEVMTNFVGSAPYAFSIGDGFQSSNLFEELEGGTYTVTVQDANGCEYTTNVTIDGIDCNFIPPSPSIPPAELYINFPNIFSPNNDLENSNFYFPNYGLTEITCKIYNRWGVLVYEWNEVDGFWDGKNLNGEDCAEGTYYYTISYSINNSAPKNNKGFVTLVR